MKKQQGFTLIELMIVVAIIGILAAVAIPAYQDYTARAQASEAVALLSGLKTPISEYYQSNGAFPDPATNLGNVNLNGKYVSGIEITNATSASTTGIYTATFNTTGIAAGISGGTVQMIYDGMDFTCGPGATDGVDIAYLPSACNDTP